MRHFVEGEADVKMQLGIKEVVARIRETGEVRIDCGGGGERMVRLADFRNATEAAMAAIECARYSPDTSPDAETRHWSERIG